MKYVAFLFLLISISVAAQKPAYRIVDKAGKDVSWDVVVDKLAVADIVFVGEYHNNPICHWMEYEITAALYAKKDGKIILGAEMFESDNQMLLDEYIAGLIKQNSFEDEAKLWNNYETDYKPLVEFAKEHDVKFVASNIPRRYASMVAGGGFEILDTLSVGAKKLIAPLPIEYDPGLPCYKKMLEMGGMGMKHTSENLPKAQAMKDATMAHFILQNMKPGYLFIHFNGSYHSDYSEAIVYYIKKKSPETKTIVISVSELDDIMHPATEDLDKGEYTILVPSTMTKTY
ncbi:MAG: iron-regulated protein [Bacteroidetes bacterium HGW-Bacteroidetes-6]|jgi:uncharacterized iron-regulated protein|nr:MAG: iron-regulated protein [Bacteroidetes bacterium HGW-Bacteroidetes-6]